METSCTHGESAVTSRARVSPRSGRNTRNGHFLCGSMSGSVTIAPKRLKLVNTETNTSSLVDESGSTSHRDEHSKSCTFSKALISSVFCGTHRTRYSRAPLPPRDTSNTDDRCFSSQASNEKSYYADKIRQRGPHTNRNTTRCGGEPVLLSPMTFIFERPWRSEIGDAASPTTSTIVNIRAVPHCIGGRKVYEF